MNIVQIEDALLAPCMDAVIAVTERYQFLEIHRGARVFTAYREIDHVMYLGFQDDLNEQTLAQITFSGQGCAISKASASGFNALSRAQVNSGRCWTVPVLANGAIYTRNARGRLVALGVGKSG